MSLGGWSGPALKAAGPQQKACSPRAFEHQLSDLATNVPAAMHHLTLTCISVHKPQKNAPRPLIKLAPAPQPPDSTSDSSSLHRARSHKRAHAANTRTTPPRPETHLVVVIPKSRSHLPVILLQNVWDGVGGVGVRGVCVGGGGHQTESTGAGCSCGTGTLHMGPANSDCASR